MKLPFTLSNKGKEEDKENQVVNWIKSAYWSHGKKCYVPLYYYTSWKKCEFVLPYLRAPSLQRYSLISPERKQWTKEEICVYKNGRNRHSWNL